MSTNIVSDPVSAAPLATGLSTLAELDPRTPLGVDDLARLLACCTRSIDRAIRRDELPAPFMLRGRRTWTVGAILEHFQSLQQQALAEAEKRAARTVRNSA